jgi:hypothetical protein
MSLIVGASRLAPFRFSRATLIVMTETPSIPDGYTRLLPNRMCAQQTQYDRDLEEVDGQLGQLVDITARNKQNAKVIGQELEEQTILIKEDTEKIESAGGAIEKSRTEMHSVSEMTTGNWVSWILAIVFLIATIVVWVV